jgi:Ca2+-binding RTX toxin-like protein
VAAGSLQAANVVFDGEVSTLQGGTFQISGTSLVDNEPTLTDPSLVATDVQASNGVVHAIDEVLFPFELPTSNGANDVRILVGSAERDRLIGGDDNDLLVDKESGDLLLGGAGSDIFQLSGDGSRDKILDFEDGVDLIDISAWGVASLDELVVAQRGGSSLLIGSGPNSAVLQSATGSIAVADLGADSFVFASGTTTGETITGTADRDRLEGTSGDDVIDGGLNRDFLTGGAGADIFVAGTDAFDVVLDFFENVDRIDVSAWGATGFGDLAFTQLRAGVVSISDGTDTIRVAAGDREITGSDFDAEDFIFS